MPCWHLRTHPRENMPSNKVDFNASRIARLQDISDLAELLFPGNRNQQHCFLVIWFSLKWAGSSLVPNLSVVTEQHGVSSERWNASAPSCAGSV